MHSSILVLKSPNKFYYSSQTNSTQTNYYEMFFLDEMQFLREKASSNSTKSAQGTNENHFNKHFWKTNKKLKLVKNAYCRQCP